MHIHRSLRSRLLFLTTLFGLSIGCSILAIRMASPWNDVVTTLDVILVAEHCEFSEVAVTCLHGARQRPDYAPKVVPVPTEMAGNFSHRSCTIARDGLVARGDISTRILLWILPEDRWCQQLSAGAREWLVSAHGKEQWPAFVHEGELVGVGLYRENFDAVGEPSVGANLDACVESFVGTNAPREPEALP